MLWLISYVVLIVLAVIVGRQQRRIAALELAIDGLRKALLAQREVAPEPASAEVAAKPVSEASIAPISQDAPEMAPAAAESRTSTAHETSHLSAEATGKEPSTEPSQGQSGPSKKADIETALGTRWAVWVGGLALALGGIFLVRYSIEAGIFGPGVRLAMAGLLGLVLAGGGEFVRRTGFRVPVEGLQHAYVPAILTAAGAFTLFGTIYAAHGIYGFIGPAAAFVLLGLIGIGTIVTALLHGQALAGVGLLGSFLTPLLVASEAPNHWALFVFLAVVLVSTAAIARLRN